MQQLLQQTNGQLSRASNSALRLGALILITLMFPDCGFSQTPEKSEPPEDGEPAARSVTHSEMLGIVGFVERLGVGFERTLLHRERGGPHRVRCCRGARCVDRHRRGVHGRCGHLPG